MSTYIESVFTRSIQATNSPQYDNSLCNSHSKKIQRFNYSEITPCTLTENLVVWN